MAKSKAEPSVGHSGPVKIGKSINAPTDPTGGKPIKGYSKSTAKFKG